MPVRRHLQRLTAAPSPAGARTTPSSALRTAVIDKQPLHVALLLESEPAGAALLVDEEEGSLLCLACSQNETDSAATAALIIVELLIERGCPANVPRADGSTALFLAAAQGQEGLVRRLLSYDRSVRDLARDDGATPLFAACKANHAACAFALLESGAGINLRRNDGASPLCVAALSGHAQLVTLLCGARADLAAEFGGKTALLWARQRAEESSMHHDEGEGIGGGGVDDD
eukprot:4936080-Prymnesium_polylepis.1